MAYFLKKTNNKKGTYLQIYESYYDPERKAGAHRSYRPIGYVHELQATGIEDPISFFKDEVQKLNQEVIDFLLSWLTNHILACDKKIGVYLRENNINE